MIGDQPVDLAGKRHFKRHGSVASGRLIQHIVQAAAAADKKAESLVNILADRREHVIHKIDDLYVVFRMFSQYLFFDGLGRFDMPHSEAAGEYDNVHIPSPFLILVLS